VIEINHVPVKYDAGTSREENLPFLELFDFFKTEGAKMEITSLNSQFWLWEGYYHM